MNSGEQTVATGQTPVLERPLDPNIRTVTRVRRDIWRLETAQQWHPVINAYAEAVRLMKTRPASDPTSWTYQAAIHGNAVADTWRNTCQHSSWFFLPWHRMYLYWFERICRAAIQTSPNVDDSTKASWALPYWNYDRGTPTNQLPQAFRSPTLPNGSPNPLFVPNRNPAINAGGAMPASVTTATASLAKENFTGNMGGPATSGGFGGPQTGFSHGGGPIGELENVPHGAVHVTVGGLMGSFNTAGLDPVFWLHHCNIDRLWEVWDRQASPERTNPTSPAWTTNQTFHFRNSAGADVTQVSGGVVNTKDQLRYVYDQFNGPFVLRPIVLPTRPIPIPDVDPRGFAAGADDPGREAQLAGATEEPVQLTGDAVEARVALAGSSSFTDSQVPEPERVYLNVEEVRAEGTPGAPYEVYVNLPDNDETTDDNYNVGLISLFGAAEANDPDSDHQEGLRYTFDITDLYMALKEAGAWNADDVKVTFRPVRVEMPAGAASFSDAEPQPEPPVTIGRVSVFFQ
ncbi:MAG TPA: tyrosinase family protein [Actinomycetota bacterium]|nr:tyrosinase family protein [Actinomycetota bacterium]